MALILGQDGFKFGAMQNKMQQAIEWTRQQAIAAAEAKFGHSLMIHERNGIQRINSLMLLESMCRSFTFPDYTAEKVLADLESFAKQTN